VTAVPKIPPHKLNNKNLIEYLKGRDTREIGADNIKIGKKGKIFPVLN
jgi:hypothetical protein